MTALRQLLTTVRTDDLTATWNCPPGFRQGRGAWGGLAIGAMLDAATRVAGGEGLVARSLTAHLVGPVAPGDAHVALSILRRGSATVTVQALLTACEAGPDGEPAGDPVVVADAVVAFGRDRAEDVDLPRFSTLDRPEALAAGWESVTEAQFPAGLAPEFLSHLSVRPVSGFPGFGSSIAETVGWVAPPEGMSDDPVVLACMADAWWPATLVALPAMRPMATLAFSLDLVDIVSAGQPVLHRGRLQSGSGGYAAESRELWSADGRLLSQNQQTMVIIR